MFLCVRLKGAAERRNVERKRGLVCPEPEQDHDYSQLGDMMSPKCADGKQNPKQTPKQKTRVRLDGAPVRGENKSHIPKDHKESWEM